MIYNDDGTLKYNMTEMKIDFLVKEIFDWCKVFIDGWYGTDWEITYNSGLDAFNKIDSRSDVAWIEILDCLYKDGYSDKEIEVAINRIEKKKILLIDVEDTGWAHKDTFESKEDLRKYLIDLHSDDMTDKKDEETLKKLPLGDICEMFNWDYKEIKESK